MHALDERVPPAHERNLLALGRRRRVVGLARVRVTLTLTLTLTLTVRVRVRVRSGPRVRSGRRRPAGAPSVIEG